MGSWYINRTFFFDVHPPLGKMLIALSGYLTGYDGSFPFEKPGDKYDNVNYLGMRIFCTLLGTMIVPFGFLTVWEMTRSLQASFFTAVLLICDVGTITLTQYILLDPILLFFMMGAIYGSAKFQSYSHRHVGITFSLHMYTVHHFMARVVCLIILPAVLYTLFFYIHLCILNRSGNGDGFFSSGFQSQLRGNSLYNASMPRQVAYGGFGARQQQITTYSHKDENNRWLIKTYDESWVAENATGTVRLVRHGDLVRLEHIMTRRNLHSHREPAPITKKHNQVTGYGENGTGDANDVWKVLIVGGKDGDVVSTVSSKLKLVHYLQHCILTTTNKQLPKWGFEQQEVTCNPNLRDKNSLWNVEDNVFDKCKYLMNGTGDANDVWKVLIVGGKDGDVVSTVSSKLKLVHYLQHCILTTTNKQLPKWGFEQQEVTCNPNLRDKNSLWNVEDNVFDKLPNVSFEVYAPNFLERFIESHAVMFQGNSGLKPKEGEITSKPWQWPINYKGQFFSGNNYRIYLLGNPIIWWGNLVFLALFILTYFYMAVKRQRGAFDPVMPIRGNFDPRGTLDSRGNFVPRGTSDSRFDGDRMLTSAAWLFVGWLLHYVPFWAMGRVLYFHHYFPAHLFSSMLTGIIFSFLTKGLYRSLPKPLNITLYHTLVVTLLSSVLASFYLFSPLTYGMTEASSSEPNSTLHMLKWLDTWEF
ncbi:protein O-mannosyl-transferase 2 [Diaphorina citri]|uniref:Protein O-mannosyl-transferase 2 n=1 Tax=Diaphorina citri TaxID=121845 RepID=A0A3Q0J3Z4_DIACI|nr:protein O-mannosyl-transferase 2 [Diaphorina citri]